MSSFLSHVLQLVGRIKRNLNEQLKIHMDDQFVKNMKKISLVLLHFKNTKEKEKSPVEREDRSLYNANLPSIFTNTSYA